MKLISIDTAFPLIKDFIDNKNIESLNKARIILEEALVVITDAIEEFYMIQELKESKENVK